MSGIPILDLDRRQNSKPQGGRHDEHDGCARGKMYIRPEDSIAACVTEQTDLIVMLAMCRLSYALHWCRL